MRRALGIVVPGLAVLLAAGLVVPALLGFERYVITSGSMTGSYDEGALVFGDRVAVGDLKAGDVITFRPPGAQDLVTHRISGVVADAAGRPAFRTRGDANAHEDPWTFTPSGGELPRAAAQVPGLGYVVAALDLRWVRLLGIALPALLIAFVLLRDLWRESASPRTPGWVA